MDGLDLLAWQAGGLKHALPGDRARPAGEVVVPGPVTGDEVIVEDRAGSGVLRLEEQPVEHLEARQFATGSDLEELVADLGTATDHAARLLRVLEADRPASGSGFAITWSPLRLVSLSAKSGAEGLPQARAVDS